MNFSSFISLKSVLLSLISLVLTITSFSQTQKGDGICIFQDSPQLTPNKGYVSVSMPHSNTIGFGGPRCNGSASNSGITRIYDWNGIEWLQRGQNINGEALEDQAGCAVSMPNDTTIAIGAILNDGNGNRSGHVRIYTFNGTVWVQKGLDIDGEGAGDQSGFSVSMPSNNTVAIGAIYNDGGDVDSGHTRIFEWDGNAWVQKGADIDGIGAQEKSGYSLSMPNDNTIAIGSINENNNRGSLKVFEWDGNAWVQRGSSIFGDQAGAFLGWSVSMPDLNTVAAGGPYYFGPGYASGYTKIFEWTGFDWVQKGADIIGEAENDRFGGSVSMPDSDNIAIGAFGSNQSAGRIKIFTWDGNAWVQKGNNMNGIIPGEWAGRSLSMPDTSTVGYGSDFSNLCGTQTGGGVFIYDFCTHTSSTQTVEACDSYTWIDGNTYTSNTTAPVFNFEGGAANGCDSVVTLDLTINTVDNSVYRSGSTLQAIENGATYQWVDCNNNYAPIPGETDDTFTATENGSYALVVTKNNCTDTSNCFNMTTVGLGDDDYQINGLSIYPNPSTGIFNIKYSGSKKAQYTISDITGRVIKKGDITSGNTTLDLSLESKGTYFLKSQGKTYKIVKR